MINKPTRFFDHDFDADWPDLARPRLIRELMNPGHWLGHAALAAGQALLAG